MLFGYQDVVPSRRLAYFCDEVQTKSVPDCSMLDNSPEAAQIPTTPAWQKIMQD
jgi:hypothetical protein